MASGSSAGRPNSSAPRHFTSVNNRLYFHGGYWGVFGIWVYDPNTTTTNHLLNYEDIGGISFNTGIVSFGNKLIVTADDSLTWTEPYEVEIQTGNFRRLGDINPGKASSNAQGFVVYKDLLFFVAVSATTGRELYLYDGSGTPVRLTDIAAGTAHSFVYGGVGGLGRKVYFTAKDTSGIYDLYSYDILSKKVTLEFALQSYNAAAEFVVYGNKLFFSMGYSLMMFDGLTAPVDIASLNLGLPIANPQYLAVSNGRLFFSASNQGGEEELYMLTDSMALEVPEERLTGGAHVYPNPASTNAHISFTLASAAKLTVRLTDIQGRILHTITKQYNAGKQEIALPVQELATGIYIYSLMDAEGTVLGRGKLTKQ
jgi:ELWxxDGT repeat protein